MTDTSLGEFQNEPAKIVRVGSRQEAEYEAHLHGLHPADWRYIHRTEQVKGITFQMNKVYYINYDVSQIEIDLRLREIAND